MRYEQAVAIREKIHELLVNDAQVHYMAKCMQATLRSDQVEHEKIIELIGIVSSVPDIVMRVYADTRL